MMTLTFNWTTVQSRVDGTIRKAKVIICPQCAGESFISFFIISNQTNEEHQHMQCCRCGESYCLKGEACE